MKTTLLFIILFSSCTCINTSKAQQLLNGGFEEVYMNYNWEPNGVLTPNFWGYGLNLNECPESLGNITSDSYNGDWAIKLETISCGEGYLGGIAYTISTYPNPITFPEASSHSIYARPDQISFYYKFAPINMDTALVRAWLFNYPPDVTMANPNFWNYIDTIAFVEYNIIEANDNYNQLVLNFDYQNVDIPSYVRVEYYSDKKAAIIPPIQYGNPGTTLWIDDVELIYLTTATESIISSNEVKLFPNPVAEYFSIDIAGNTNTFSVTVYDYSGRIVRNPVLQKGTYSLSGLAAGLYFLQIETDKGSVVKKVIKE